MPRHRLSLGDGTIISEDSPVFIIAEIGQNHQGEISIAKELIKMAKDCGADCVKFQKSCLEAKFTKDALETPYLSPHAWANTYGEHKRYLEFSEEQYIELQMFSTDIGMKFTASAMDIPSLVFLASLDVPFLKIGSGDSTNTLLLEEAAALGRPLIISTGMCSMEDVERIYLTVSSVHQNFALLHCVSSYPTKPEDANLRVISLLRGNYPIQIGYSGHEEGFYSTLAAVTLGAKIVERHITLNKQWKGSDHRCSLDILEFQRMVQGVREIEKALGEGNRKQLLPCEIECWEKLGKCLVAARDIPQGTLITKEDLAIKVAREKGLPGRDIYRVIGKRTLGKINTDSPILKDKIENFS